MGSLHVLKMADDHDDELDNYSDNEGEVGDSSLLDPQISDDVLLDHEDLGDDPNKKEEISNLEEEEAVSSCVYPLYGLLNYLCATCNSGPIVG